MGHHKLREDKKCQNCGYVVRKRFCPKCGQENVETRQSFHYLFTHFIEDLVHYDGSFWKTVKNLLFKPGVLTKEYLEGKRKKFVAPVKLYIFVSFFVFFVGGSIGKFKANSDFDGFGINKPKKTIEISEEQRRKDSLMVAKNSESWPFGTKEKTLKEYDSIQNNLPENLKDKGMDRLVSRKEIELKQKYTKSQLGIKIMEVAQKNIPKFLFFYMPVFAFFMWVFHSKKKWFYFDHGIFTLHYFSFLLLAFFTSISVVNTISELTGWVIKTIAVFANFAIYIWAFIYFFKAHREVYGYSKINTLFRGLFLLFLNMIFLLFGIIVYMFFIFYLM
jgi:hypothetical protein